MMAASQLEQQNLDDVSLLRAYFDADARDCMDELIERHMAWTYRLALGYARNSADAEEAVQATFLELLQCGKKLAVGDDSNLRGWLARVLIRICRGKQKSDQSRRAREARAGEHEAAMEPLQSKELIDAALQTITGLPERYRLPVSLHFIENWSYKDIAQSLALEEDTVRQQANRGLEMVRQSLLTAGFSAIVLADPAFFPALRRPAVPASLQTALRNLTTSGNATHSELNQRGRADRQASSHFPGARRGTGAIVAATIALLVSGGYVAFKLCGTAAPQPAAVTSERRAVDMAANGAAQRLGFNSSHSLSPLPSVPSTAPSTPQTQSNAAASTPADPKGPARDTPAAAARASAPKQWQEPRFIAGDFHPLSLSIRGSKLELLTAEAAALHAAKDLVLFESNDAGQTWTKTSTFEGYISGYGDFDQKTGDYAVLALTRLEEAPTAALKASRARLLTAHFDGLSSEVLVRKAAGATFAAPRQVWKAEGEDLLQSTPRLFCASGGWWAFQPRVVERRTDTLEIPKHTIRMRAAHGEDAQSVRAVPGEWEIPGRDAPVAWARDERTAGFVNQDGEGTLHHHVTTDGGASWQDTVIPFQLPPDSGAHLSSFNPSAITRDGDRLLLLVFAEFNLDRGMENVLSQRFILLSTDLGKTWSAPSPASPRDDRVAEGDGVHILGQQFAMGEVSNPGLREQLQRVKDHDYTSNKSKVNVRLSDDGGKTWYNHHAFAQLSDGAEEVLLGGDADTLHVCLFLRPKANFEATGCLVIRSFAPGNWAAPTQPAPDWFKAEQAAPAATTEEF